jgi:hypothetical protein
MDAAPWARVPDGEPVVLCWPDQQRDRDALAAARRPRLLVVAEAHPPPHCRDPLEDWIREPVDPLDQLVRLEQLRARHRARSRGVEADEGGVLSYDGRWVALTDVQLAVIRPLLADVGRPVPLTRVSSAYQAAGGADGPQALRRVLSRLRGRIGELGLELHLLSGRSVLLEVPGDRPSSNSS